MRYYSYKDRFYNSKTSFTFLLSICLFILSNIMSGCSREKKQDTHIVASQLFHESMTLLKEYTDSLKIARDSAHVELLDRAFDSKINALNFDYLPETDLYLTEEENDSLIKMAEQLIIARKSRLKSFSVVKKDTISGDSLVNKIIL